MKQNRIYKIVIDSDLDEKLKNFQENILSDNEEIVSTSVANIGDANHPQSVLIVVTKEMPNKNRNLLVEERQKVSSNSMPLKIEIKMDKEQPTSHICTFENRTNGTFCVICGSANYYGLDAL
ncbi:hypothetical protein HYV49_05275 [Candidatus Pacearchaeota archaeon]|nr:hypothetical protein [Candidatus Pacearchaeota archaeon]